jgi:hypothetical protein
VKAKKELFDEKKIDEKVDESVSALKNGKKISLSG